MRIAIIVASVGRPNEVGNLIEILGHQVRTAEQILISVESDDDLPAFLPPHVRVIQGPRGASSQRNRALDQAVRDNELIAFLDDDYIPSKFFLERAAQLFTLHADIAGATGLVLADGVNRGSISLPEARTIIQDHDERVPNGTFESVDIRYAYGCNMVFRSTAIAKIRFDENLPLYSWQEDVDFAARTLSQGRIVKTNALVGVHRGVTGARTSGKRFGYSQIVNPLYLLKKGTMRPSHVARLMSNNLIANHLKAFRPEGHIDRLGRVKGNWLAISDCLRGKVDPRRILEL